MTNENDIAQPFPLDYVCDVLDMGREVDTLIQEVRALTQTGEGRREDLVSQPFQLISHAPPAPATMPSAVYEDESLSQCLRSNWRNGRGYSGSTRCYDSTPGSHYRPPVGEH